MEVTKIKQTVLNAPQIKSPVPPKKELPFKITPPLILGIGILLVLIGANIFLKLVKKPVAPGATAPTPALPAASINTSPATNEDSEFGKSPQFQEFEKKLKDVQSSDEAIDLSENSLGFPVVEMHVDYSTQ